MGMVWSCYRYIQIYVESRNVVREYSVDPDTEVCVRVGESVSGPLFLCFIYELGKLFIVTFPGGMDVWIFFPSQKPSFIKVLNHSLTQ